MELCDKVTLLVFTSVSPSGRLKKKKISPHWRVSGKGEIICKILSYALMEDNDKIHTTMLKPILCIFHFRNTDNQGIRKPEFWFWLSC